LRISSNIIGVCQVQERREKRKECEEKGGKKRWEEINTSKVVKVRSLNLDLDVLWKDLEMKLWGIVEDCMVFLFTKFEKKKICFMKVMSFWRFYVKFGFLIIYLLFEPFWIWIIIKDCINEKNIMPFGYVLKEIQVPKMKSSFWSHFFLSDNFLWLSSIGVKILKRS
jgi:hypothetical protein